MVKYLLLSTVILFVIGLILYQYGKRPARHKVNVNDDLSKYFKALLNRGYDGGLMFIEAPDKERFLQFRKYIEGRRKTGIEFGFPLAPWSRTYYESIKKLLEEEGINYWIEETGESVVAEFLKIDLRQNIERAIKVTKLILKEAFQMESTERIVIYFVNVSPKDERIGF